MACDSVNATKPFLVYVQENGIIRMSSNDYAIGRLSEDIMPFIRLEDTIINESEEE